MYNHEISRFFGRSNPRKLISRSGFPIARPISRYHCSKECYLTVKVALKISQVVPTMEIYTLIIYHKISQVTSLLISNTRCDRFIQLSWWFQGQASSSLVVSQASHILFHMQCQLLSVLVHVPILKVNQCLILKVVKKIWQHSIHTCFPALLRVDEWILHFFFACPHTFISCSAWEIKSP